MRTCSTRIEEERVILLCLSPRYWDQTFRATKLPRSAHSENEQKRHSYCRSRESLHGHRPEQIAGRL